MKDILDDLFIENMTKHQLIHMIKYGEVPPK